MSQPDSKMSYDDKGDFPYNSWERVYRQSSLHELPWDTPEAHPLLIEMFKDHQVKPGSRALDLGCGTGASSRLLAKAGYEVEAWDVSETAIARARALSKDCGAAIRFITGNALRSALNSSSPYHLILDFFFLHHVQPYDIDAYFSGIRRALDAEGTYTVGVFVHDGNSFRRPSLFSEGEVTYWSCAELEAQLGAGWGCTSIAYGRGGSDALNYPMGLFEFVFSKM
ncbi:MAG: class I SAM-dependent methyltransferase [Candidatus Nitrotoga sp.]